MTLAMVKVLPEPVTPSSVWYACPPSRPSTSPRIASGWSPCGSNADSTMKREREDPLRLVRQHDPHVVETPHRDRKLQLALRHDLVAHEVVHHALVFRHVRVGAELFGDLKDLLVRDHLVDPRQVVQFVAHQLDALQNPLIERKAIVVVFDDLRVPGRQETLFEALIQVYCKIHGPFSRVDTDTPLPAQSSAGLCGAFPNLYSAFLNLNSRESEFLLNTS